MSSNFVGGSYDNNKGNGFALLVVLFILLIIVGTAFYKNMY
ncbi:YjcZ family sporulation protein [Ureibacillus sp. MALMAid1270]